MPDRAVNTKGKLPYPKIPGDWPYTWRCLDCGYVGRPSTTDRPDRRRRLACPRDRYHREMVGIKIIAWDDAEPNGSGTAEMETGT